MENQRNLLKAHFVSGEIDLTIVGSKEAIDSIIESFEARTNMAGAEVKFFTRDTNKLVTTYRYKLKET